jgi:hypothetical protein
MYLHVFLLQKEENSANSPSGIHISMKRCDKPEAKGRNGVLQHKAGATAPSSAKISINMKSSP